jgi:hypothetical protein
MVMHIFNSELKSERQAVSEFEDHLRYTVEHHIEKLQKKKKDKYTYESKPLSSISQWFLLQFLPSVPSLNLWWFNKIALIGSYS